VRTTEHPALGRLELWGSPQPRSLLDFVKPRDVHLEWRGVSGNLPITTAIDKGIEPEAQLAFLDAEAQSAVATLGQREPELRSQIAAREIGLARDWANNNDLSEESFAKSLRASGASVYTDIEDTIIDLYFEDTANIFGGHDVIASLDRFGRIVSSGIEG
jgi:hypothetical protein